MRASSAVLSLCTALAVLAALGGDGTPARADELKPASRPPRGRACCAFASRMPIHMGAAHLPLSIDLIVAPASVGTHSYTGDRALYENNGLIYTRRGGFVDVAHTRDNADFTANLALRLRPLLAAGAGSIELEPKGASRTIRVLRRAPPEAVARTSELLAQRIVFQLSVWTELVQYYGLTKMRGAEEVYSAFTPDDLYSNLLGTYLGVKALESPIDYDRAMDVELARALAALGAVSAAETRATLWQLAGTWWRPNYTWPESDIAVARMYEIGPLLHPRRAPKDAARPPVVLEVPERDADGVDLASYYRLEIVPHPAELPRIDVSAIGATLTADDLPRLVDAARRGLDAEASDAKCANDDCAERVGIEGAIAHYLTGVRVFELDFAAGAHASYAGSVAARGVEGGTVTLVRGDTRGGDFDLMRFDLGHTAARGVIASLALLRADSLYFCHDPEKHDARPPLVSLLGPCATGEWLGVGGSLGEALHDGGTGRTALRPVSAWASVDLLGNGQSPSYDFSRVLLRAGGAVEHVWTTALGGRTIPRAGGSIEALERTHDGRFEARAATGYRVDVADVHDVAFESDLRLRRYFLVGGTPTASTDDRLDVWALAAVGVEGAYTWWTRPPNAYPEIVPIFVSAEQRATWQLLGTLTFGFEGLAF